MAEFWRIIPVGAKELIKIYPFRAMFYRILVDEAREAKALYYKTTRTWKRKVKFKSRIRRLRDSYELVVWYDDEIYGYVDLGTRPHIIKPRRAKILRFPSQFRPKTKPRVIGSYRGMRKGPMRTAKVVVHPGTKPRYFTAEIMKRRRPKLNRKARILLVEAARRARSK